MLDGVVRMTVRLLGPLEVMMNGRVIVVDTRKALAIVALVAGEGRPFARDELAAMFWPDADDEAARGALRRTLSTLRTSMDGPGFVIGRTQVALDPEAAWVDLAELERLVTSDRVNDLEAAAELARGPFLAGFTLRDSPAFDDWQAARRVRVEGIVGDLLDRLVDARQADGNVAGALDAARRRVELDSLDEPGQRRLIGLLARSGDRAGAIRQYRSFVALLESELGVAPLRETSDVYDSIREGRPEATKPAAGGSVPVTAASRASVASPFVGRGDEFALIMSAWAAATPDGRMAVIEGEAGIGKTRLAHEVAATVLARGGTVLAARGYPGEAAIAYGPIAELLRAGLAIPAGPGRLESLDEIARHEIGRLVDLPASVRAATRTGSADAGARVRLLDGISRALGALAESSAPGLIWVDDIHLADGTTGEALVYLARRLIGRPVLLLVTWRPEDLIAGGAVSANELLRVPGATVVSLPRLDRAAIAAIVRAGRPPDSVDDTTIDAIAADSEGLPVHVVEATGSEGPPGTAISRGFKALLRERLAGVGETAAQVVAAAAVIGRSFDLATVRQTSGRSEEEAVDAVEELIQRGFVREMPGSVDGPPRYDFVHGRMRDVAYETTSLARRRLLHRRTADALRVDPSGLGRDDVARFALIGGHEREAGRSAEAAEAFREAADRAQTVFANREAIDHLEAAIALGDPHAAVSHARIGELRARLGEYPAAITALETAAALAPPPDVGAVEVALGRVHRRRGDLSAAASHLAAALEAPTLSPGLRALALVERSMIALQAKDLDAARTAALGARDEAARADDPHLAGRAERLMGLVGYARGDPDVARDALARSVDLASDDPDPTALIAALTALALALAADGAVEAAVETAARAIDACRRIGDRHLEAAVENHIADMLHEAGRRDDSMSHLKRAVALFAEIGEGAPERDPGIWALAAW